MVHARQSDIGDITVTETLEHGQLDLAQVNHFLAVLSRKKQLLEQVKRDTTTTISELRHGKYSALTGFPHLLESSGIVCKIPGTGKSWKMSLSLKVPEILSARSWKVLENEFGPGKFQKCKCKVMESPGFC